MAQRLTDAAIKRLRAPSKANRITYDDDVAGFGIRITAARRAQLRAQLPDPQRP
jgi:hypothetical protein